jgi:Sulfotransferase family
LAPRAADAHAPVIILAAARSYSSVVVAALGSHPGLYGFPELILFAHGTVGEVLDRPALLPSLFPDGAGWRPAAGLERAVAEVLLGGQQPGQVTAARRYLEARRRWSGAALLDELLGAVAPLVGVEKSPETAHHLANMDRVLEWYPRARFVHLVRHPVSYQRSLQAYLLLADRPDVCARSWLNVNRRIAGFCRRLPPDQVMRVRAEQVVAGDPATLARLAWFAGVAADDDAVEAMRHPERSPYASVPDAVVLGGLDSGFLASPALRPPARPASLAPPAAWRLPGELISEITELARSFGYALRGGCYHGRSEKRISKSSLTGRGATVLAS